MGVPVVGVLACERQHFFTRLNITDLMFQMVTMTIIMMKHRHLPLPPGRPGWGLFLSPRSPPHPPSPPPAGLTARLSTGGQSEGYYFRQWRNERQHFQGLLRDGEGGQSEELGQAEQAGVGLQGGASHRQDRENLAPGQPVLPAASGILCPGMSSLVFERKWLSV